MKLQKISTRASLPPQFSTLLTWFAFAVILLPATAGKAVAASVKTNLFATVPEWIVAAHQQRQAEAFRISNKVENLASDTLQPTFPGGEIKLGEFLGSNINYPIRDLEYNLSGYVFMQASISETGKVSNYKVLDASQKVFAQELERVLSLMPVWEPAKVNSQPVSATYIFPIMFKIANREEAEVNKRYKKVVLKHQAKIKRPKGLTFAPAPITITLDTDPAPNNYSHTSPEPIDYSKVTDSAHLVLRKPIFTYVEQQPEFPGGEAALKKFLARHIKLTPEAVANNIHGEMIVSFIVDDDGTVMFPEVFKKLGYGLDEEVLRVIRLFPKFKPGHQNKKKVVVRLRLPIQV